MTASASPQGEVEVLNDEGLAIAHLGEGSLFGEVAFFKKDSRRLATVRARAWLDDILGCRHISLAWPPPFRPRRLH
jgi:hypothetical protein